MADEPQQWEFGSPLDSGGGSGGDETPEEQRERERREKKKSPQERIEDAKKAQKRLKKLKDAPKKAKQALKKAKELPGQIRKGAKAAQRGAKAAAKTGKAAVRGGRAAAQAAIRSARIASQVAIRAAQVAARVAAEAAKVAAKVAANLVKFLLNPYVLAAVIIIIIIILIINIFLGAVNQISSLAGGSIFVPANYDNPIHRQIVSNLQSRMTGCDPRLVVYRDGQEDLEWQVDDESGRHSHKLDIRLLRTLDYLTDDERGHRIKIELLKTGAPNLLRESFIRELRDPTKIEGQEGEIKETLSAFFTGQAMAISEIDRSEVLPPTDMVCGVPVPPPVQVNWQETVMERALRPVWEELSFSVGFLDKNVPVYKGIADRNDQNAMEALARAYKASLDSESYDLFKETFSKIPRVYELIKRGIGLTGASNVFDPRTAAYLSRATGSFNLLNSLAADISADSSDEEIARAILDIGESADRIREGASWVYKATQVANMVGWDAPRKDGNTKWQLAYEARVKIRQVTKELLEMPREVSLTGELKEFDNNLVVKQIITFSPEDDLDNGLEKADVFPWGIVGVDVGGVQISLRGDGVGDEEITYADSHFSHAPIDNGVFSKNGTNYIYGLAENEDEWWEKAGALMFKTSILGNARSLHDLLTGGAVTGINEVAKAITYKDFLHVAF